MTEAEFNQIWVPRIGEPAAAQLRRGGDLILAVMPMLLVCGLVLGALVNATFTLIFWGVAVLISIIVFGIWLRGRMALARKLSAHFGRRLRWYQLPRWKPASFERWCDRLGLTASAQPAPAPGGIRLSVVEDLPAEPARGTA